MTEILYTKILPLLLSMTPISLILINKLSFIFSKHNPKLGKTTTICTNITGTLTKPTLNVKTIIFDKYKAGFENEAKTAKVFDTQKQNEILAEKIALLKDNSVELMAIITTICKFEKTRIIETVISKFFFDYNAEKQKIEKDYTIVDKLPITPEKKYSTVIAMKNDTKEIFSFTKGNPFKILYKCAKMIEDGKKIDLDPQMRRKIRKRIEKLNRNGQKTIAFAMKALPLKRLPKYTEKFAETEMVFLGVIGVSTPLNTEAKPSIEIAKKAGIKIYILTNEKEKNAIAIGTQLNIINPNYFESLTGGFLRQLSDVKLEKMLANKEKDYLFAELNKEDKYRIMENLRKNGEVVAVVNKRHKDGLQELVEGIKKGRLVEKNYKKYTNHAIVCKINETILMLIALALNAPLPLTIISILVLDFTVNLMLELSLRAEFVDEEVMSKNYKPQKLRISFPTIVSSIITGIILSFAYILNLMRNGWELREKISANESMFIKSASITFILLAIIQIINAFNFKKAKNVYLTLTIIISALLIYITTNFETFRRFFNLSEISVIDWEIIMFFGIITFLIGGLRKFLFKHGNKNPNI